MLSKGRLGSALSHVRQRILVSHMGRHSHMKAADCLEAIERLDGRLNAVVHKDLDAAAMAPEGGGGDEQALKGMCVLVKDSIDVKGMPSVVGDKDRVGMCASEDAPLVQRVRDAGAIILGKTNVPAGCLDLQTFNDVFGVTNNPYDPSLTPGGSTGGGAAAVSAGMVPLALGSDLSGSLRIPASFCGVASIRPTEKRLPTGGHVPRALCEQNNMVMGAVGDSTATLHAFMASSCAGPDDLVRGLPAVPWRAVDKPKSTDLKILLTPSLPNVPTQAAIVEAMENFGQQLESWGVDVHRTAPDLDGKNLFRAHKLFSELAVTVKEVDGNPLKRELPEYSPRAQQLAIAEQIRNESRKVIGDFLGESPYTAWVLPTAGVLPFPHNPQHLPILVDGTPCPYWQPLLGYAFQASACGNPVVTIPVAMAGHLPVGVQVIGRMWADEEVLAVANTLELLLEDPIPPPPIHVNRV